MPNRVELFVSLAPPRVQPYAVTPSKMSDSEFESESFSDTPTAQRLEKGLRDTVASIFRTGNTEELTVKRVRLATEQALGLDEGFFKGHSSWRARSDQIIRDEVVRIDLDTETFSFLII